MASLLVLGSKGVKRVCTRARLVSITSDVSSPTASPGYGIGLGHPSGPCTAVVSGAVICRLSSGISDSAETDARLGVGHVSPIAPVFVPSMAIKAVQAASKASVVCLFLGLYSWGLSSSTNVSTSFDVWSEGIGSTVGLIAHVYKKGTGKEEAFVLIPIVPRTAWCSLVGRDPSLSAYVHRVTVREGEANVCTAWYDAVAVSTDWVAMVQA